jgi:hypothetical protein
MRREIAELRLAVAAATDAERHAIRGSQKNHASTSTSQNAQQHETFELMRRHAASTSTLIKNQEAMIAELRGELRAAMELDGDDRIGVSVEAAVSPSHPSFRTAARAVQFTTRRVVPEPKSAVPKPPPAIPEQSSTPPRTSPDWASAYADIDATRVAVAAMRPKVEVEEKEPSPSGRNPKTDWEAAYMDIEATRAFARAGKRKEVVQSAEEDIDVERIHVPSAQEVLPVGESYDSLAPDSPDPKSDSPDKVLAQDLMDSLAALGSSGADALLAQSPAARKKETQVAPVEEVDEEIDDEQPQSTEELAAEAEMFRNINMMR